jgi:hypothetical protein
MVLVRLVAQVVAVAQIVAQVVQELLVKETTVVQALVLLL